MNEAAGILRRRFGGVGVLSDVITYKALALVWLIFFVLVALSGSGMVVGSWVLLLVVAALVMPALILTLCATPRRTVGGIPNSHERGLIVSAVRGSSSVESGGIDDQWENEGGAPRTNVERRSARATRRGPVTPGSAHYGSRGIRWISRRSHT